MNKQANFLPSSFSHLNWSCDAFFPCPKIIPVLLICHAMDVFSPLNIFGAATVTAMMLSYIAEERARVYTLSFCATCVGASAYGWLSGT